MVVGLKEVTMNKENVLPIILIPAIVPNRLRNYVQAQRDADWEVVKLLVARSLKWKEIAISLAGSLADFNHDLETEKRGSIYWEAFEVYAAYKEALAEEEGIKE